MICLVRAFVTMARATVLHENNSACCHVFSLNLRTIVFTTVWCLVFFHVALFNNVTCLQNKWKFDRELESMRRQQELYRRMSSTPSTNQYRRPNGVRLPSSSLTVLSPVTNNEVRKSYRPDELIKHTETSVVLPYVERQHPNSNPWSTLYNTDRQSASDSVNLPPSLQLKREKTLPNNPKSSPVHLMNLEAEKLSIQKERRPLEDGFRTKEFYRKMYGTQEGLKYLRTSYGPGNLTQAKISHGVEQELEEVRLANEHFLRMRNSIRCHIPVAEVVCVKDIYTSPQKEYLPRCTLLHRCGDRSGCCDSENFKCVPRAIQEVSLNFYALQSHRSSDLTPENSIEKLLFENHTECECTAVADTQNNPTSEENTSQETDDSLNSDNISHNQRNADKDSTAKCRECPKPFSRREYEDGRCSCDCFDKQKPCIKIKKGREALPTTEKRCVESGRCHIPDCEYGLYISSTGRCRKRPEDLQKSLKNGNGNHKTTKHNHRWTFFERD